MVLGSCSFSTSEPSSEFGSPLSQGDVEGVMVGVVDAAITTGSLVAVSTSCDALSSLFRKGVNVRGDGNRNV